MIKLCTDAGFAKTVALGQYFITKDAEEFSEFDGHEGCREYTLPRDDESSTPRGWIRGNTKLGLVLEVTTNYHQVKPGVEFRVDSLSNDGTQLWIIISNGLNRYVRDLTEKTQTLCEIEDKSERTAQSVIQESGILEHSQIGADKLVAKEKPKPTTYPLSSPSPTSIPVHE